MANQTLTGTNANDSLVGADGDDSISGGEGNDTLFGEPSNSPLMSGGNDTVDGGPGDDTLSGGFGAADSLLGGPGNDVLTGVGVLLGGDGDDRIEIAYPAGGAEVPATAHTEIDGGAGNDTITLAASVDTIDVHWAVFGAGYQNQSDVDTLTGFDPAAGDRIALKGVSNLVDFLQHVRAIQAGDHIDLTYDGAAFLHVNTQAAYSLDWFQGDPTAPPPPPPPPVVIDQTFIGTAADDFFVGGPGNDTLSSGGGRDTLFGASGNDSISTGAGHSVVNGNQGEDEIVGVSPVGDWLSGGQGNDLIDILGSTGANIANGNMGADTVTGGIGDDTLRGGQGDDLLRGSSGKDWIFGDLGDNTVTGGAGADTFFKSSGVARTTITDFNPEEGDRLALGGAQYAAQEAGTNLMVFVQGGDTFTLIGKTLQEFTADWVV